MPASADVADMFNFAFAALLVMMALGALIERHSRTLSGGRVEAVASGSLGSARPELVTEQCGPLEACEDCYDPTCECGHHRGDEP